MGNRINIGPTLVIIGLTVCFAGCAFEEPLSDDAMLEYYSKPYGNDSNPDEPITVDSCNMVKSDGVAIVRVRKEPDFHNGCANRRTTDKNPHHVLDVEVEKHLYGKPIESDTRLLAIANEAFAPTKKDERLLISYVNDNGTYYIKIMIWVALQGDKPQPDVSDNVVYDLPPKVSDLKTAVNQALTQTQSYCEQSKVDRIFEKSSWIRAYSQTPNMECSRTYPAGGP